LGFRFGATVGACEAESGSIVTDHAAELWTALGPAARVIVVDDNAGRELLDDLALIAHSGTFHAA